jgi:hypothetical protein
MLVMDMLPCMMNFMLGREFNDCVMIDTSCGLFLLKVAMTVSDELHDGTVIE